MYLEINKNALHSKIGIDERELDSSKVHRRVHGNKHILKNKTAHLCPKF